LIYWTWDKPIVVLCNQNTVSNGEIFSHAIRTLKRGQLVGVPTVGGVISTPVLKRLDLGEMGMPNRAWCTINDGEDMEMNGAMPDHVVWPEPGHVPAGRDVQLETAVRILQEDVEHYLAKKAIPLKYAASRKKAAEKTDE
jgi:tricorn protease